MEHLKNGDARRRSAAAEPTREQRRLARQRRHTVVKERLSRIDAGETLFFDASGAIAAALDDLEEVIAAAERRVSDARTRAADKIAEQRIRQARAAAAIRAEDCSIGEVADILQITPKQVRELLSDAQAAADSGETPRRSTERQEPPAVITNDATAYAPMIASTSEVASEVDPSAESDAAVPGVAVAASQSVSASADSARPLYPHGDLGG